MIDVMVKPDNDAAELAVQTATVTKYYYYHPENRKAQARTALRRIADSKFFRTEDGMADVALEELWNILVGN